jgi:hypothetical protein
MSYGRVREDRTAAESLMIGTFLSILLVLILWTLGLPVVTAAGQLRLP